MSTDGWVNFAPQGRGRKRGGAALRVSSSGHAALSQAAADILDWPETVLIAARDGAVIIKAATPDDHRAYRMVYDTAPNGRRINGRFSARAAFIAAGMLPETGSAKYVALECDSEDGRRAILMRADVMIPVLPWNRVQAVPA